MSVHPLPHSLSLPIQSMPVEPELGGVRRGAFFRALFDGLAAGDQEWVLDLIARYARLNAESGDPARF